MVGLDNAVIEARNLHLSFGGLQAVEGVSFKILPSEIFALVGPNGSGKTSILNMVSGIYRCDSGEIVYGGENIIKLPPHKRAHIGIARTFQMVELFSHLSVLDNLLLACHTRMKSNIFGCGLFWGFAQKEELLFRELVEQVIEFFEIEQYRKEPVANLPLGTMKLVGVARALVMRPKLLLLDEPSAGMTFQEKEDLARFLLRIKFEIGIPMLWVEHDVKMVTDIGDRAMVLDFGQEIASGTPEDVLQNPEVQKVYFGLGE